MSSENEQSSPGGRRMSGRLVLVIILVAVPLVLIGLLLSGTATTRYLDLRTFERLEVRVFRIGSFELGQPSSSRESAWPDPPEAMAFVGRIGELPEATPDDYFGRVYEDDPSPVWFTTFRAMPFAFLIHIDNKRVLNEWRERIVGVRLAAARVLEPEDRGLWRALDERLFEGLDAEEPFGPRERSRIVRTYIPAPGEEFARELLDPLAEAADAENPEAATRQLLLDALAPTQ